MNQTWLLIIIFWIFYIFDFYKTRKGILPDTSNEGNPLTAYLYRRGGQVFFWIHALYGLIITLIILFGGIIGLWLGYSATTYNFIGYLSWTRLNRWKDKTNQVRWTPALLAVSLFVGYLLMVLHKFAWTY